MSDKYDVFVFDNVRRVGGSEDHPKLAIDFLMHELRDALWEEGLENGRIGDTVAPEGELTEEAYEWLKQGPIFITEHHIEKTTSLDPVPSSFCFPPFRVRPTFAAYDFANLGKKPHLVLYVAGRNNSGKSLVMDLLANLIRIHVPETTVHVCPIDDGVTDKFDILNHTEARARYVNKVKDHVVGLSVRPHFYVSDHTQPEHNIKL